jgi:hypothetical protein
MGRLLSIRLGPEDVDGLAREYGFSKENFLEEGSYHYTIVLRKQ